MQFASGALGTLAATTIAYPGLTQDLRIHGDRGYVQLSDFEPVGWDVPGMSLSEIGYLPSAGRGEAGLPGPSSLYAAQYADLIEAIVEPRRPAVTGEDGRAALEVVLAVYDSAVQGRSVRLGSNAGLE
jgi:predicted dehydrogenase